MNKMLAVTGVCAALLGLLFCARQGPQKKDNTLEGILEDLNETVVVIKDPEGKEHMFWRETAAEVDAVKGDRVRAVCGTGKGAGRKVRNLLALKKI